MAKARNRSLLELAAESVLFNLPSPERRHQHHQTPSGVGELAISGALAEHDIDPQEIFDFRSLLGLLNRKVYYLPPAAVWQKYEIIDEHFKKEGADPIILVAPKPLYAPGPIIPRLNMTQLQRYKRQRELLLEHDSEALMLPALPQVLELPENGPRFGSLSVLQEITADILDETSKPD